MAVCDITPLPHTLTFEDTACIRPRMVNVRGDIYACVYEGSGNNGYLVTFSVNTGGNISERLDLFVFQSPAAYRPDIAVVGTGFVAIVFQDSAVHGGLSTYEIDAAGIINETRIDYYMFETGHAAHPNIVYTGTGNIYVIAYEDGSILGWVKTVTIDSSGIITKSVKDSLRFDAVNGGQPIIKRLRGNIFIIFYIGYGTFNDYREAKLCSLRIEDDGEISDTIIDDFSFEITDDHPVDFVMVLANMLACVYRLDSSHGRLKTIGCGQDGFFNAAITDFYDFPDANFAYPHIAKIGDECFAITYQGVDDDGWMKTIIITTAGAIAADITDSLQFDEAHCVHSQLRHIEAGTCLLVYEGDADIGVARSTAIQPVPVQVGHHEMCMGIGP